MVNFEVNLIFFKKKSILKRDNSENYLENKENNYSQGTLYWVGRESQRLWSTLALKAYESQLPFNKLIDQTGIYIYIYIKYILYFILDIK